MTIYYEALLTDEEVARLTAMGFCHIGDGVISRVGRRVDTQRLDSVLRRERDYITRSTPPAMVEHKWRQRFGDKLNVGADYAGRFPASESTVTMYIMLYDGEISLIQDVRNRIAIWDSDAARLSREDAVQRQNDYTAEALF